jgi:hypothetical protein
MSSAHSRRSAGVSSSEHLQAGARHRPTRHHAEGAERINSSRRTRQALNLSTGLAATVPGFAHGVDPTWIEVFAGYAGSGTTPDDDSTKVRG